MAVQVVLAASRLAGRGVQSVIRRGALAATIVGLSTIYGSAYGADVATAYSRAVAAPPHVYVSPADRRSVPARPIDPPGDQPKRPVQRAAMVDRLYDELIRSSGCALAPHSSFITSGC